jgi:hypothetical protein
MMRFPMATLLLFLGGCSTGGQDPRPAVPDDDVKLTYRGPEVQATLQEQPGLHQLRVTVQVPSGGYRLLLEETRRLGAVTAVYLTLESPGPEEAVTMALEEKEADVPLQPEEGAVHVFVRQVQRNVQYVQRPQADLANVVKRK